MALVNGDPEKVGDLIKFDMERHDEMMNEFATLKEFHIIFEDDEDN